MSPELTKIMKGEPIHIVADGAGVLLSVLTNRISIERASLGLTGKSKTVSKKIGAFLDDWKIAIDLRLNGARVADIASKWNISTYSAVFYLSPWVDYHHRLSSLKVFTISEFLQNQQFMPKEFIISVNRIHEYKVVRL